jgi:hypothetical protein
MIIDNHYSGDQGNRDKNEVASDKFCNHFMGAHKCSSFQKGINANPIPLQNCN